MVRIGRKPACYNFWYYAGSCLEGLRKPTKQYPVSGLRYEPTTSQIGNCNVAGIHDLACCFQRPIGEIALLADLINPLQMTRICFV
jgi:hypothetical protein